MSEAKKLSIGVIGVGTIVQSVHLTSLRRAGFDVRMICDLSPSRAHQVARETGAEAATDPRDVFESSVDAVLIATPGSHAQLTAEAVAAGKHVLAEKPLAYTMAEVDELERLAAANDVVVQVGYMKMFDPIMPEAAARLQTLNGVRVVEVTVMHPADDPQVEHLRLAPPLPDADPMLIEQSSREEWSRARRALPDAPDELVRYYMNVLNGSVVHELSVLRSLGIATPTQWDAQVLTPLAGNAPATLFATGRVGESTVVLSWNWLPEYPEYEEQIRVLGSNGRLTLHMAKPYLVEERSSLEFASHKGSVRDVEHVFAGHETGFLRQLDAFARAIRSGHAEDAILAQTRGDIKQLQLIAQAIARSEGIEIQIEKENVK